MTRTQTPLMTSRDLSEYLAIPLKTIADWAYKGTGPRYTKAGRRRVYRWDDVQAWLDERASDR